MSALLKTWLRSRLLSPYGINRNLQTKIESWLTIMIKSVIKFVYDNIFVEKTIV